jgi:hypothetical protein
MEFFGAVWENALGMGYIGWAFSLFFIERVHFHGVSVVLPVVL